MNTKEFENLYNKLTDQPKEKQNKQQDKYLVQFDIQQTKFAFFKNQDKHYLCKFSFDFLGEPQRVEVQFKGKNDLQFKIDDSNDSEQIYDLKKFKEYFNPQFLLFKEAFAKFKQFLDNNKKIKKQQNNMIIVPLKTVMNTQKGKQQSITMDGVDFLFNEIENTFEDTFRVDFELAEKDIANIQKYAVIVFKIFNVTNFYILQAYLSKNSTSLEKATILSKNQFAEQYPTYISKLNKAINTYLNMNH